MHTGKSKLISFLFAIALITPTLGFAQHQYQSPFGSFELIQKGWSSKACGGPCLRFFRNENLNLTLFEFRNPATGELMALKRLDLPPDARIGDVISSTTSGFNELGEWVQYETYPDGATAKHVPEPPLGGTGPVTESVPYYDNQGNLAGFFIITYFFENGHLTHVEISNIECCNGGGAA